MGTQRQIDMTFDISYPSDQAKFLQRLGEKNPTDIVVQVFNKGVPYNLSGVTLGFEMRNDKEKILIDKDQSRFTLVLPLEGVFSYRPPLQVQSFYGNSYLAYFTFESGANRVTTERFRFYNDEDVQLSVAPALQEHYVSVIDDLVASNKSAMDEAKAIRDLINANGVVRKTGDTMTGNLDFDVATANKWVGWKRADGKKHYIFGGNDVIGLFSEANSKTPWRYIPSTDTFDINASNTNLLKKAGDTMTGNLTIDPTSSGGLRLNRAGTPISGWNTRASGSTEFTYLYDYIANNIALDYSTGDGFLFNKKVTLNGETNVVKKTGDTITGNLDLSYSGTGTRKISFSQDGNEQVNINRTGTGYYGMYDVVGNQSVWEYTQSSKTFNVNTPNTNLMKKTDYSGKDGTAVLALENGATAVGSRETFATRAGNTVTLQLNAKRTNNTDSQICMLPANMRPAKMLVEYKNAVTGVVCQVVINTNGAIQFHNNNLEVSGVITYTVN